MAPQILHRKLPADLTTPVRAFAQLAGTEPSCACLFESVEGGVQLGRYSIIALKPDKIWEARGHKVSCHSQPAGLGIQNGEDGSPTLRVEDDNPLASLAAFIAASQLPRQPELPPIGGGIFGYLGFDTVRWYEPVLGALPPHPFGLPDGLWFRPQLIVVFDNVLQDLWLLAPTYGEVITAEKLLAWAEAQLKTEPPDFLNEAAVATGSITPGGNETAVRYGQMVDQAKEYIAAGDIFQVVPSQRYSVPYAAEPFQLYRAVRRHNPAPFMVFMRLPDAAIVAASPEVLVRVRDGEVAVRPIAGTRPRGKTPIEDQALADELINDPKERAEHMMLLDLGRNDVGRVSEIGSVNVITQMVIERYAHVMHIVSEVRGKLRKGLTALDALMAGFPAGTVSGAPKIRAIQIINELEKSPRGLYGGGIGYFNAFGDLDSCIALRTGIVKDGMLHVQAGGGIVADSDPVAEHQESMNKAKALLRAIGANF